MAAVQVSMAVDQRAAAHSGHHHHAHGAHEADKSTCSACSSCCSPAALPTIQAFVAPDSAPIGIAAAEVVPPPVFLTDGPERPPRFLLA
jgi:hypothetical protein